MIEVKTPKNILVYKTRILGPLNLKQTICFALVFFLDFIVYQTIIKHAQLSPEIIFYIYTFLDIPILLFAYYEPMGISLEKYLKNYLRTVFVAPKWRKNKKVLYKAKPMEKKKVKKSKTYKAYN